jgi:hypothetical protein
MATFLLMHGRLNIEGDFWGSASISSSVTISAEEVANAVRLYLHNLIAKRDTGRSFSAEDVVLLQKYLSSIPGLELGATDTLLSVLTSGEFPKKAEHRAVSAPAEPERKAVDCTVFAPDRVEREQSGLLQVFLHAPNEQQQASADAVKSDPEAKERGHKSLVLDAPVGTVFCLRRRS